MYETLALNQSYLGPYECSPGIDKHPAEQLILFTNHIRQSILQFSRFIISTTNWLLKHFCIHSYIIFHYNPLVGNIDFVSKTLMLCILILCTSGGTYSLKSTPNDRFFLWIFHGNFYLLSEFLPENCWEKIGNYYVALVPPRPTVQL